MNAADIAAAQRLIAQFEGRADGRHNSTRMADRQTELEPAQRELPNPNATQQTIASMVEASRITRGPGIITFTDGIGIEISGELIEFMRDDSSEVTCEHPPTP